MSDEPFVRVSFRKSVSDGNYGSEAAEVTLSLDAEDLMDDIETDAAQVSMLLSMARRLVHQELRESPSSAIRSAAEYRVTTKPAPANGNGGPEADVEELPF